jgi:hypothetical protein
MQAGGGGMWVGVHGRNLGLNLEDLGNLGVDLRMKSKQTWGRLPEWEDTKLVEGSQIEFSKSKQSLLAEPCKVGSASRHFFTPELRTVVQPNWESVCWWSGRTKGSGDGFRGGRVSTGRSCTWGDWDFRVDLERRRERSLDTEEDEDAL